MAIADYWRGLTTSDRVILLVAIDIGQLWREELFCQMWCHSVSLDMGFSLYWSLAVYKRSCFSRIISRRIKKMRLISEIDCKPFLFCDSSLFARSLAFLTSRRFEYRYGNSTKTYHYFKQVYSIQVCSICTDGRDTQTSSDEEKIYVLHSQYSWIIGTLTD